jgi:ribosomal protein S14
LARLVGGYESPIQKKFLQLCRDHFRELAATTSKNKQKQGKKAARA